MSDKTNQATPTPERAFEFFDRLDTFQGMSQFEVWEHGVLWADRTNKPDASLLAENEKLRGLVERTKIHLEYVSKYYENPVNKQKALDLLDEITAALSGEQEGTPLK